MFIFNNLTQSIFMNIWSMITSLYKTMFWSLEKQAIRAGVKVGKNNFIASRFWDSEPYLITVGNNCQITNGVKFYTHGGGGSVRKTYPKFDTFGKIKIGDYVYIGSGAKIMPGVTIGDNVIVAAGSIVTKSIPSNVVVGGNPAKYICTIEDYIERNMKYNLDSKGLSGKIKEELLKSLQEEKFIKKPLIKITK